MIDCEKNAERFKGFADIYDSARPSMPLFPVEIVEKYLRKRPQCVVDLGCGTGLSSMIWLGLAEKIIGIEPSDDMRAVAEKKANDTLSFIKAYSHDIPLADHSVDAVICSQSFHWMEPESTLREVGRILTDGGVFATVDCDWPPVSDWQVEKAYTTLFEKVRKIETENPTIKDSFVRYDKDKHLENIIESHQFRYAREIVFSNTETCTAERLVKLALSQGSLQAILKNKKSLIENDTDAFIRLVKNTFNEREFDISFSYRMRIGIK